jgi:hypothetical protein
MNGRGSRIWWDEPLSVDGWTFMIDFNRTALRAAAAVCLVACLGCSGLDSVPAPEISPQQAAQKAMELYDTNKDGKIADDELKAVPSLAANLKSIDTNGDSGLSEEEIAARLQSVIGNSSRTDMPIRVTMDGRPLAGASIRLVPDEFLAGAIREATGTTDENGVVQTTTVGESLGTEVGLYRVIVTKDGQTIPDRYNTNSEIGVEVSTVDTYTDTFTIPLSSR